MSESLEFTIDGVEVTGKKGQTIMEAADENGIYIPRLCYYPGIHALGSCRVCTVSVNGRFQASCHTPLAENMDIEVDHPRLNDMRKALIEMLFVEGNHFCPSCEKSGECDLQALAYRFRMLAPRFPFMFPCREPDASHREIFFDGNRCIQCRRCVYASRVQDKKRLYAVEGRGRNTRVRIATAVDGREGPCADDAATRACPVGAIIVRGMAYRTPYGSRRYDKKPIGHEIESRARGVKSVD